MVLVGCESDSGFDKLFVTGVKSPSATRKHFSQLITLASFLHVSADSTNFSPSRSLAIDLLINFSNLAFPMAISFLAMNNLAFPPHMPRLGALTCQCVATIEQIRFPSRTELRVQIGTNLVAGSFPASSTTDPNRVTNIPFTCDTTIHLDKSTVS